MKTAPKQEIPMSSIPSYFTDEITFDILAAWAGEAVFQRGRAYQKAGKVRNIALASEDRLLATVDGTRKYATLLFRETGGKLASLCTCPYGPCCKHAVALACACLALSAEKQDIPLASDNDNRLLDLDITFPDETTQAGGVSSPQALEAALKTFSKKQLIALVLQAVHLVPEVAALCLDKTEPQQKNALAMVKDARKAMRKALEAPDWDDYYRGTPDY
ncbi:MAG: SWIM zinc finger family protein, partial [Desulfarculales bacterium]|nr:SWIM zinc finger family protein [Desulfarculales bacterium]